MKYLLAALFIFCLSSPQTQATRFTNTPPFPIRYWIPFTEKGPTGHIGFMLAYELIFTNLSDQAQTGTLTFASGSEVWARNWVGGSLVYAETARYICGINGTATPYTSQADIMTSDLSKTFTVPAKTRKKYQVGVVFRSSTLLTVDSMFSPKVDILVDQDRGALAGTIYPILNFLPPNGPPGCGGVSQSHGGANVGQATLAPFIAVPFAINGGRPF